MKSLISILLLIILSGCSHLRPDASLPATESNYDTAEIVACGKRWHGLGVCRLSPDEPLESLKIGVQGYSDGEVAWYSQGCQIDYLESYSNNSEISLNKSGLLTRSCLITVTVSPKFSRGVKGDLVVSSFRGHIAVKLVSSKEHWLGETRKFSGHFEDYLKVPVQGGTSATVVFRGCGTDYKKQENVVAKYVLANISEAAGEVYPNPCILDGFVFVNDYPDQVLIDVLIHRYNEDFIPLPIPEMVIEKNKLKVKASVNVSIVSLDKDYVMSNEHEFSFDASKKHVFRALTVKGRSVVCEWNLSQWTCQQ